MYEMGEEIKWIGGDGAASDAGRSRRAVGI